METGQSQTSSAWWMCLFSQLNQLNGSQLHPQQEYPSRFQQMLSQLQMGSLGGVDGSQTETATDLDALSASGLNLEALIEGDAMTSVAVMDPEKIMQAIQSALGETSEATDFSLQELNQRLALLKQEVGDLLTQSQLPSSGLATTKLSAADAGVLRDATASQYQSMLNQQSPLLARQPDNTDEFFYRFAASPGTVSSAFSSVSSTLRPIVSLKGVGNGDVTPSALLDLAGSKETLPNGMLSHGMRALTRMGEQAIKEQKTALDDNTSTFKTTAQATRSMLVESSAEAASGEGADVGADSRKDSGLEAAMKLKLQDPNVRSQLNGKLADRIQMMVNQGIQHAKIQLDPPELGMLEVKIQFQQDQVQVNILSQSSQVRDALEGHSVRLRDMLEQQGIQLAGLDVQDQGQKSAGHFSDQDQKEQRLMSQQWSDDTSKGVETQASAEKAISISLRLDLFV
jgi:flagellar hook-length control protein FliK